jgi:hypothetical protein
VKKLAKGGLKIGDRITIIHYTPVKRAAGVKDELGTEDLFRRIIGHCYRIMGFDEYGHVELHPTRHDSIWINPQDVELAPTKTMKKKLARSRPKEDFNQAPFRALQETIKRSES